MTVLTQPRPGDTGEIQTADLIGEKTVDLTGERTTLLRPMTPPTSAPAADTGEATTYLTAATRRVLLALPSVRLPDADPNAEIRFLEPPLLPSTGAERAIDARSGCHTIDTTDEEEFTTSPTPPPRPLPTPPPAPKPTTDAAVAQPVGYVGRHRLEDKAPFAAIAAADVEPATEPATALPARTWPNLVPRLLDRLTGGAR